MALLFKLGDAQWHIYPSVQEYLTHPDPKKYQLSTLFYFTLVLQKIPMYLSNNYKIRTPLPKKVENTKLAMHMIPKYCSVIYFILI